MAALTAEAVLLQRYHLTGPIEDRGLGETWEGVDSRIDGRRVLVKVLDPCDDEAHRKAVVARLQALRMFRHPGALAVTDHGVFEGRPFVVHDLPPVGSLATLLDRHRAGELDLPLDKIAALVARLAEVLHAGHDEPEALVHGALRPRAVLVPDDLDAAQAVLIDVGLRDLGGDPDAPKDSAAAARCLTPEQFAGEPLVPRTDTFALGLVVLELLRAPPSGVTQGHTRYLGRPDVPDAVWDAVLFATRIPIPERPSVEAFADLLGPAWTAPPVAEPTAPLSIPTPPAAEPDAEAAAALGGAPSLDAPAPAYAPRVSIPPGGLLGVMPSLGGGMAMPPLGGGMAMPPLGAGATPALAVAEDHPIEFGERTVALDEAPDLASHELANDPLGSTRTMSPQQRTLEMAPQRTPGVGPGGTLEMAPQPGLEMADERTIVAFAVRMQAVDDMLSTVERALPPELDDVAARFRAQMAASKRRDEPAGGMPLNAPRRPEPAAPAPPPSPVAHAAEPEKPQVPLGAVIAALAVVIAVAAVLLTRG